MTEFEKDLMRFVCSKLPVKKGAELDDAEVDRIGEIMSGLMNVTAILTAYTVIGGNQHLPQQMASAFVPAVELFRGKVLSGEIDREMGIPHA